MALFRNLSVNLRDSLFPPSRRDAQSLDFLDLAKNCSFLNRKLELVPIVTDFHFWMGTSSENPRIIKRLQLPRTVKFSTVIWLPAMDHKRIKGCDLQAMPEKSCFRISAI